MRRTFALAALALSAALAAPAGAVEACTPSAAGVTVGGCVRAVCIKLCATEVSVDPQCEIDRPAPVVVHDTCAYVDGQFLPIVG